MVKKRLALFLASLLVTMLSILVFHQYHGWQTKEKQAQIESSPQGKLPNDVTPTFYRLDLTVDPSKSRFSGIVSLSVRLTSAKKYLWLHGKGLDVRTVRYVDASGQDYVLDYEEIADSGVARLTAKNTLPSGDGTIVFDYSASFSSGLSGLYRVNESNTEYAFTQFQPISARTVFPSFDEPRFKTPFDVAVTVRKKDTVVANTGQVSTVMLDNGFKKVKFETTQPLSTYLIAFAVGEFEIVEFEPVKPSPYRDKAIPLRGVTTKGKGTSLSYVLANTGKLVNAFENYFAEAYPYAKLDLVAVPDFAAGAMENAGLITYREKYLLLDDDASLTQKRAFASIHAHELAHQWFGNLVTMSWWDDLWLNESFASWLGNKIISNEFAELGFARETLRDGQQVMLKDSYLSTRKIRESVIRNGEINATFDSITYDKGAAILSMLERSLGESSFRLAVQYYIKRHKHSSANTDEFVKALHQISQDETLEPVVKSFTEQNGVPLLSIKQTCQDDILSLSMRQERYQLLGLQTGSQFWTLPVCLNLIKQNGDTQTLCTTLTDKVSDVRANVEQCPVAIMPNAKGSGYYRWQQTRHDSEALLAQIANLTSEEKLVLAKNYLALYYAGQISLDTLIDAHLVFIQQSEWDVFTSIAGGLANLQRLSTDADVKNKIQEVLVSTITPLKEQHIFNKNTNSLSPSANERLFSLRLLSQLVNTIGDKETVAHFSERAVAMTDNQGTHSVKQPIDYDLLSLALSSSLKLHGEPYAEDLINMLEDSNNSRLRQHIIYAVAGADDAAVNNKALTLMLNTSLRLNERMSLLFALMNNRAHLPKFYRWFKRTYGMVSWFLPNEYLAYAPLVGRQLCSKEERDDFENFLTEKMAQNPAGLRRLNQTLEQIDVCVALKAHASIMH